MICTVRRLTAELYLLQPCRWVCLPSSPLRVISYLLAVSARSASCTAVPMLTCPLLSPDVEPEDDNSTDIPLELAPGSGAANDTLHPQDSSVVHGRARIPLKTRFKRVLKMRVVWIGFVLIIVAFGTLDTLSAWMVDYLTETRHSPEAASRYMLSGLWAGEQSTVT